MEQSETLNDLLPALLKARSEMNEVYKTQLNQFLSDKNKKQVNYANLADFIDASIDALTKNSLLMAQTQSVEDGKTYLVSTLFHISGQFLRSKMILPTDGGPQIVGGLITYFRKYQYGSMLNLAASEDDDGNKAQKSHEKKEAEENKKAEEKKDPIITTEQFFELEKYFDRLPKDIQDKVLKTYEVEVLGKIKQSKFEIVRDRLKLTIEKLNQKQKDE